MAAPGTVTRVLEVAGRLQAAAAAHAAAITAAATAAVPAVDASAPGPVKK